MYGPVRTVVWQGSAGDRRPYADQTPLAASRSWRRCITSIAGRDADFSGLIQLTSVSGVSSKPLARRTLRVSCRAALEG